MKSAFTRASRATKGALVVGLKSPLCDTCFVSDSGSARLGLTGLVVVGSEACANTAAFSGNVVVGHAAASGISGAPAGMGFAGAFTA